jgi:hypothetical protein
MTKANQSIYSKMHFSFEFVFLVIGYYLSFARCLTLCAMPYALRLMLFLPATRNSQPVTLKPYL